MFLITLCSTNMYIYRVWLDIMYNMYIMCAVLRQFVGLLEDKTSVEDLVEWGQSVLQNTVKVRMYV